MRWNALWILPALVICGGCNPSGSAEVSGLKKVVVPPAASAANSGAGEFSIPLAKAAPAAPPPAFVDVSKLSDAELDKELAQDTGHLWVVLSNFRLSEPVDFVRHKVQVDYRLVSGQPRRIDTYHLCFFKKLTPTDTPQKLLGEGFVRMQGNAAGTITAELSGPVSKHDIVLAKLCKTPPNGIDPLEDIELSGYLAVGEKQSDLQPPPLPSDTFRATPEQPLLIAYAKTNNVGGPSKFASSAGGFQLAFQVPLKPEGVRHYLVVASPEGVREDYDLSHEVRMRSMKPYTLERINIRTDQFSRILGTRGPYQVFFETETFVNNEEGRKVISNVVIMP